MTNHVKDRVIIITGAGSGFGKLVAGMTAELAENVVYVINQPWGVNISDITVRASGDVFIH